MKNNKTTNEHEATRIEHSAAPDLLEALEWAAKLIPAARRYFPKSIRNTDKFDLENTCATIGKAIAKASCPDPVRGALQRLLSCPDLNMDSLDPETIAAIEQAQTVLKK